MPAVQRSPRPPTVTVTGTVATSVTVDLASSGPAVTDKLLGMNMAVWYDLVSNQTGIVDAFQAAGITQVRWPGGSDSDLYHWATNSECDGGYADANDTFSNFVNDMAVPADLDVALTANYGSNAACNGGGEPSEAAAWVTAALADGITVEPYDGGQRGVWELGVRPALDSERPHHLRRRCGGNNRLLPVD